MLYKFPAKQKLKSESMNYSFERVSLLFKLNELCKTTFCQMLNLAANSKGLRKENGG